MEISDGIWLAIFVVHLPTLVMPVVYYLHRDLDPIKVRRPRLLTFLCVVVVLWTLEQIGQCALGAYFSAAVEELMASTLMLLGVEGFFMFALSIYVAFSRTRRQLRLAARTVSTSSSINNGSKSGGSNGASKSGGSNGASQSDGGSKSGLRRTRRAIRLANFLCSDRFAAYWVGGHLLVQLTYQSVFLALHPALFTISKKASLADEDGNGMTFFQFLDIGRCLPTLLAFLVLSFHLRIVVDAFGTKLMLKRSGQVLLVSVLLFLGLQGAGITYWHVPYVFNVLTGDFILWAVYVQPLLQALSRPPQTNTNRYRSHLERFLSIPEGYAAFQKHLEREFAVENLLFWHDVQEFQAKFARSEAAVQLAKVRRLYDRYVREDAPLQVNLPAAISQTLLDVPLTEKSVETGLLHWNLFADAAAELVRLMEVNSLHRFVEANGRLWTEFLMREDEGRVFDSLNRATMTTEILTQAIHVAGSTSTAPQVVVIPM